MQKTYKTNGMLVKDSMVKQSVCYLSHGMDKQLPKLRNMSMFCEGGRAVKVHGDDGFWQGIGG